MMVVTENKPLRTVTEREEEEEKNDKTLHTGAQ
jgi:hypothetical protein